jgi:predicted nucleic acid-binding protein
MILLDTNVVSEGWRPRPDPKVVAWLDAQSANAVYLCTPVLAELRYGVERLDVTPRKDRLRAWIDRLETETYSGRILALDLASTREFGRLSAQRERIGRRMEPMDALIAAIALTNHMALATRDTNDFADLGLELINPFAAPVGR